MSRKLLRTLSEKTFGNEWDRLLAKAERRKAVRFLLLWNRGLGDIALGLYRVVAEIRERISNAEITVATRPELAEAFQLLPVDRILVDEKLVRGAKEAARLAFERLKIEAAEYDVVLDRIDPTRWFAGRMQRFQPKLDWCAGLDALSDRFDPCFADAGGSSVIIGAHVQSETGAFYGYRKDWPTESWQVLFTRLETVRPVRFVLFGNRSNADFDIPRCIDLRGQTSLLEMLALIKNRCSILVAPDSGVLTMSYYIDAAFRIDLVSLWADPHQGILKQGVASPNPLLRHLPLFGANRSVQNIDVEQVLDAIATRVSAPAFEQTRAQAGERTSPAARRGPL